MQYNAHIEASGYYGGGPYMLSYDFVIDYTPGANYVGACTVGYNSSINPAIWTCGVAFYPMSDVTINSATVTVGRKDGTGPAPSTSTCGTNAANTVLILTASQSAVGIPFCEVDSTDATVEQDVIDYLTAPSAPYMDCDVYTKGVQGNKMISFEWDNLQNIPAGMYESYQVRIGYNMAVFDPLVITPYKSKFYQVSWLDYLNYLPADIAQQFILDGRIYGRVDLFHMDGSDIVVDWNYSFEVMEDGEIDITIPPDAGTATPHEDENPGSSDQYGDGDGSWTTYAPGQAMSVDNLLTRSYVLDEQGIRDFGDYCWNNDLKLTLFSNQVAPLENILSCKRIPFAVTGTPATVWLGNLNTGIAGSIATSNHLQDLGYITVPVLNGPVKNGVHQGNWLDFLTNVSIYLPYCGIQTIPTKLLYRQSKDGDDNIILVGRQLGVKYIYDIVYGSCAAVLSVRDKSTDGWSEFAVYNGSCGIDIPITASNRASNELSIAHQGANAVTGSLLSAIGGVMKGGLVGGLIAGGMSALSSAGNISNDAKYQERHYTTAGGFSSQVASYLSCSVILIMEHVLYTEPTGYGKENGYPCNLSLYMSDLSGYTELDGSIEIEGIPCLDEERTMLKQALMDGFYL